MSDEPENPENPENPETPSPLDKMMALFSDPLEEKTSKKRMQRARVEFVGGPGDEKITEIIEPEPAAPKSLAPVIGWRQKLLYKTDSRGAATKLEAINHNVGLILEKDERWEGVLALNEFSQVMEFVRTPPWAESNDAIWTEMSRPVCDEDFTYTVHWISKHYGIHVRPEMVANEMKGVAKKNRYHPVRDYLTKLEWDGVERLSTWLEDYCGAFSTSGNPDYIRKVGRAWMISAVARVMRPGCKADHVLILEGKQGIFKSTVFKTLAGDWFTDQIGDLSNKDAALQAAGVWIVELAELDAMSRHEVGRVKAFLSISFDRIRPPYGHTVMRYDRQCVFAGTVNHTDYLRDETGNRRFWPVRCADSRIEIDKLAADRDQLWAEAVVAYRAREKWWLDEEKIARVEQEDRMQVDVWEEPIAKFLEGVIRRNGPLMRERAYTVIADVLAALQIPVERQGMAEARRVVAVLKRLGWLRRQVRNTNGIREWRYMAPEEESPNV